GARRVGLPRRRRRRARSAGQAGRGEEHRRGVHARGRAARAPGTGEPARRRRDVRRRPPGRDLLERRGPLDLHQPQRPDRRCDGRTEAQAQAPGDRNGGRVVQAPGPIEYERASSVQNAIELLEKYGPETRLLAGGHSLLPMMKLRLANPERLIDINELDELSYIREADGEVRIGAMTRHRELLESELLARHFPVFIDAESVIADPPVRNRGTIGGSLAQADAAEDLSAVCSALKASVVIAGSGGERVVSMDDFHIGPYMTAVQDAEILTEIRFPVGAGGGSAHE